jgi:dihydroorotase-like cyclic amidohydrolase
LTEEKSYTDFGISAHPPRNPAHIEEYLEAGAFSVTLFPWDLLPWATPLDLDDSYSMFARYAELGLKGLIFPDELAFRETPLQDVAETYALQALLRRLHPDFNVRVIVTLPSSVDAIMAVRERLPNLQIQVASYALFMSREVGYERIGSAAFHSPPLRPAEDVARLREHFEQGKIDILASQHTPHRMADKYSSIPIPGEFTPKAGYSAIDITYPLLLTKLGFRHTCRCYCENPAKHLGLKKGIIAKGYEADLAIVEEEPGFVEAPVHVSGGVTEGVWKIEPTNFHSKGKVTPFVGERLKYRVVKTFLRGEEAYDAETRGFTRRPVRRVY